MEQNHQNVVTSHYLPQNEYRSTQNLGLPINSRLIAEPGPNLYLNNYQSFNQPVSPQQVYTYAPESNTVRTSNVGYQSIANPITSYTSIPQTSINYDQQNIYQPSAAYQRSGQNIVRSRLVPVTQYVPVYEVENVQGGTLPTTLDNQTIHQRIILHEPEAFKQRLIFEEKDQAVPTMIEEAKLESAPYAPYASYAQQIQQAHQQVPSRMTNTKIVKVSQDPLVETVQGGWRSKVSASRQSYSAPAPLPREEKACCSGWLLLLLGLIAFGGILAAVLLGKNSASKPSNQESATAVTGIKVGNSQTPSKIQEVAPLTNAQFTVKGTTAVAKPVPVQSTVKMVTIPSNSVPPTDISIVAKTETIPTPTSTPSYVKPQQMNLVSVAPITVPTENLTSVTPIVPVVNTRPTITPATVEPRPIPTTTPMPTNPTSVEPIRLNSTSTQPASINYPKFLASETILPFDDSISLPAVEVEDKVQS